VPFTVSVRSGLTASVASLPSSPGLKSKCPMDVLLERGTACADENLGGPASRLARFDWKRGSGTGLEKGSGTENAKHPSGRSGFRYLTPFSRPILKCKRDKALVERRSPIAMPRLQWHYRVLPTLPGRIGFHQPGDRVREIHRKLIARPPDPPPARYPCVADVTALWERGGLRLTRPPHPVDGLGRHHSSSPTCWTSPALPTERVPATENSRPTLSSSTWGTESP
jgi:hypothetical protein